MQDYYFCYSLSENSSFIGCNGRQERPNALILSSLHKSFPPFLTVQYAKSLLTVCICLHPLRISRGWSTGKWFVILSWWSPDELEGSSDVVGKLGSTDVRMYVKRGIRLHNGFWEPEAVVKVTWNIPANLWCVESCDPHSSPIVRLQFWPLLSLLPFVRLWKTNVWF